MAWDHSFWVNAKWGVCAQDPDSSDHLSNRPKEGGWLFQFSWGDFIHKLTVYGVTDIAHRHLAIDMTKY